MQPEERFSNFTGYFSQLMLSNLTVIWGRLIHVCSSLASMMYYSVFAFAVTIAPALVTSAPTKVLDPRVASQCGQYSSLSTGSYTLYTNEWGASTATSGSQCSEIDSLTGSSLAWSTSWSWSGGTNSESPLLKCTTSCVQNSTLIMSKYHDLLDTNKLITNHLDVKSYTNVESPMTSKLLSQYTGIPTTWSWRSVICF